MTTSPTRHGAEALMAIRAISNSVENSSHDTVESNCKVIGKLSGTDIEYWISKDKVVIGRNSSHGKVDVNIGISSYVSRRHLQINYEKGRFFLVCLGKNGVFVDGQFQRLGANPMPLDKTCVIRFPSTSIRLTFNPHPTDFQNGSSNLRTGVENITTQQHTNDSKTLTSNVPSSLIPVYGKSLSPITGSKLGARELKREFSSPPLKYMIPRDARGFLSAPPSPTGTISALNSCPSSPRRDGQHYTNQNVTENLNAAASVIAATVLEEQMEKGSGNDGVDSKPPYSYAQLIIQAISSAPHRQLTLSGIYAHITKNYPYYRTADKGWQNSIRHNLSLNRYFVKVPRSQEESGKGSFWKVDPSSEKKLVDQAWRKRRQRAVPCFTAPLTASVSSITRSAPVSPERSTPISPLSSSHGAISSSQEESHHPLQAAEHEAKMKLVQLKNRYAQSAPGSPSEYSHAVVMTTATDANLMTAAMNQQRTAIMTSATAIPLPDNGMGKVIWPVQQINTQKQGSHAHVITSTMPIIKEETSNGVVAASTTTPMPYSTAASIEASKVSLVMQPPNSSSVIPSTIATLTAQQHQQLLQRQQQVVMVSGGQNPQRIPQAIPINIGTIVTGPNALSSSLPFVLPGQGNQQFIVKRINEESAPLSEASPAKKAKTEDNNPNESTVKSSA